MVKYIAQERSGMTAQKKLLQENSGMVTQKGNRWLIILKCVPFFRHEAKS